MRALILCLLDPLAKVSEGGEGGGVGVGFYSWMRGTRRQPRPGHNLALGLRAVRVTISVLDSPGAFCQAESLGLASATGSDRPENRSAESGMVIQVQVRVIMAWNLKDSEHGA